MADELIQAGIFEGMAWWSANPAKSFFSGGCMSPAPIGGEGLGATWQAGDRQMMINGDMGGVENGGAGKSLSGFYEDPPMVDCSAMGFGWNHHHILGDNGDYTSTTAMDEADVNGFCPNSMMNPTNLLQGVEWSKDFNCSSSPPTTINSTGNSSGTDGSTVSGDAQIPLDTLSMFPSMVHGDFGITTTSDHHHETVNPNWNNNQALGTPFAQQRQQQIINDIRATLLGGSPCSSSPPSPRPPSQPRKIANSKPNKNDEACESSMKRRRIETPSPLPTFKVRKEKLGDRITALQQLVSPFGKTDTASVLHEAIEYVKFLHDQVNALSTPYMKNGAPVQRHLQQQANHNQKSKSKSKSEGEATKRDLRSRGLCLVPIASTFPVAHETPADFWTPTFGANFR